MVYVVGRGSKLHPYELFRLLLLSVVGLRLEDDASFKVVDNGLSHGLGSVVQRFTILELRSRVQANRLLNVGPPIVPYNGLGNGLVVLRVVFSRVGVVPVLDRVVRQLELALYLLSLPTIVVLLGVPVLRRLFLSLYRVALDRDGVRDVKGELRVLGLASHVYGLLDRDLLHALRLSVLIGVLLKVLHQDRDEVGEGNGLLVNVVVRDLGQLASVLRPVPMDVSRLPMGLVLLFLHDVLRLLLLRARLLAIALRHDLRSPPRVQELLVSAHRHVLYHVVDLRRL